jgi:large subunit ribosomal protein L18e
MKKSKTKISKQSRKKTNPLLVKTINMAKKNNAWIDVACLLSGSKKNRQNVNLKEIENMKGDILIVGKVLSEGNVTEKKKIVALSFSKKAIEKLKSANCETIPIIDEIKKNPGMKGLKILKNG